MAGRTLNRRELRKQADQAEQTVTAEGAENETATPGAPAKKKTRAKAPAAPKV